MAHEKLISSLSSFERIVLPLLESTTSFEQLVEKSKLQEVQVMRTLQWLENKGLVKINKKEEVSILLDENGIKYKESKLPELRLLDELKGSPKKLGELSLPKEELGITLGLTKKRGWVQLDAGVLSITPKGKEVKTIKEQEFLETTFPRSLSTLTQEELAILDELKSRKKIITLIEKKVITLKTTPKTLEVLKEDLSQEYADRLTPKMLKDGTWKDLPFRRYDVEINVPSISGGRRHFANKAVQYARQIWLDLGFEEMGGDFVQTSFWNFDALFTPQDHPVREMQDTFFVDVPGGKLPDAKIVEAVKNAHENGVQSSSGWGANWHEEEAKKVVLRTHTTVLSALMLAKNQKYPAKYFALGRCFRNEALDWSHLFEFNQTEGIVIDPDANFTNLLGYLREFFRKMGFEKARFRPAYFPYTEPSVEIDVFHPTRKKWLELGGAGMLRPEVVIPLIGKDIPVLAWGPGIDRLIMDFYELSDLRNLYSTDLEQIKKMKEWIKCQQ